MRCGFSEKKVRKLAKKHGLPIVSAMTRGGSGHRIDVILESGEHGSIYPDRGYVSDAEADQQQRELEAARNAASVERISRILAQRRA